MFDLLGMVVGMGDLLLEKVGIKEKTVKPYHSEQITPKKYSFRPQNLDQYIGQARAKELININLQKIKEIKPVHFIISGSKGTGKSTLAYIVANELGLPIMTYVGGSFTRENIDQFLKVNETSELPNILFCDEIHGLEKSVGEFMYTLLEDYIYPEGGFKVRPFIFIGCTTNLNILQNKLAPLIDRCQSVNLEHYSAEDIKAILKQYNDQLYKLNIEEEDYDLLSQSCRFTPRISINYFDDLVICKDMKKVLSAHQIIKNSLNTNDVIVLRHLAEIDKPVGVEVMAILTQSTKADFIFLQEPFLIQEGYISRTSRGRCITDKGKLLLRSLNV